MTKNTLVRRAVQLALVNAAAATVALPALAASPDPQTTPAPGTSNGSTAPAPAMPALQEVVVTGSRINIPGLKSISPVTSLSAKDITQTGATTIEDVLNQLPQVTADQGAMSSNGATGTASLNLRDLGAQRTLVLVDGKRLMPGDAGTNVADINNIPTALVERVDVLTGGASSVYGADAVAGVVNFVMNDHFQGFEIDANASAYQHDQHQGYYGQFSPKAGYGSPSSSVMDGAEKDITFLMGSDFAGGKGNATAYLTYRKSNPVLQATRDFSRCTLATNAHGKVSCSGSSTSATGGFFATDAPGNDGYDFSIFNTTVDPATGQFTSPIQKFNYGTFNYYIRPDTRWNGGYFAHYNIDDNHQVYSSLMMMSDHTLAQIAPSGAFLASGLGVNPVTGTPDGGWTVNCDNPLLSAGEQSALCGASAGVAGSVASVAFGRRNVEGGNRYDDLTHTGFRMVIGSQGNLTDNLTYDVYAQEGLTLRQENYVNDVSKTKMTYALNDVVDPTTGNVICAANANGKNGAPGCVPYDMWGLGTPYSAANTNAAGGPTAAAVAYIGAPGVSQSRTEERIYHADFTYDGTTAGIKLPSANEGLVTNFGFEYREDFTSFRPDEEFLTGDLAGQGGATLALSGADSVKEGFVEMRLPLVQDKPFAKEISINPGYRYSKYDLGFSTNTYKIQADWSPDSSFRVRGGYNRAVRAPNLGELFTTNTVVLDGSTDPCATGGFATTAGYVTSATNNTTLEATRRAQCLAHGVTAAQYGATGLAGNPAGQYNGLTGGNQHLKPETADTYTFGVVFTPTFLPSFSATLDYYDIKIKDVISTIGANLIVNQCVLNGTPYFCNLVHRDGSGSIWLSNSGYVNDPLQNLGYLSEKGADLAIHYRETLGRFGAIDYAYNGTFVASFLTEPYPAAPGRPASGAYDCAGYFGGTCGNPMPKYRHVFTATWETPVQSLDVGLRWRHFGNTEIDAASPSPLLNGSFQKSIQYTGTRDYLDLNASYMVAKGFLVLVGVNNVMDKDPPVLATASLPPPFFNGNTYPQVYDTLGRYMFVNLKLDF